VLSLSSLPNSTNAEISVSHVQLLVVRDNDILKLDNKFCEVMEMTKAGETINFLNGCYTIAIRMDKTSILGLESRVELGRLMKQVQ
jgi:hypothetical protein